MDRHAAADRLGVDLRRALHRQRQAAADGGEIELIKIRVHRRAATGGGNVDLIRLCREVDAARDRADVDRLRVQAGDVHRRRGRVGLEFFKRQAARDAQHQLLFGRRAQKMAAAAKVDLQRVAVERVGKALLLRHVLIGHLGKAEAVVVRQDDHHAAAEPVDLDLADARRFNGKCLADVTGGTLGLRAEGVGRAAGVPEGVDGENAVALRQFCAECAVILPLGGHGLGRHVGGAPGVGRPAAETDGFGRIIAEIERYGVEIGG